MDSSILSIETRRRVVPGNVDVPSANQHLMVFHVNETNHRHFIRLDGRDCDGVWSEGLFGLVPSQMPIFCAADGGWATL